MTKPTYTIRHRVTRTTLLAMQAGESLTLPCDNPSEVAAARKATFETGRIYGRVYKSTLKGTELLIQRIL